MQTISQILIHAAHLLGWPYEAIASVNAEAAEISAALTGYQTLTATIAEMRHDMTITQEQVDQLTAEITANTDAIAAAAQSIEPLKASIAATTAQIKVLIDKLASAGVPFNTSALDAALSASTAQAKAISDSLTGATTPVVPTDPTTTAPPAAAETVQVPA